MRPITEAEVSEAIRTAAAPVAIIGGGTRRLGATAGAALEMSGLSGVQLYEPGALTLVVKAGTPLAEVEALLAAERQRLTFEVPDLRGLLGRSGESTLGGVVAANASGPRRVQAGACRDSLLGVRFVDGAGHVVKNGGRVMKNVTGYDLVKLMAGSRGALGVLTEVSLRVQAQPETEVTLLAHQGPADGLRALREALRSPFDVSGAAYANGCAMLRIEGMAGSVAYRSQALQGRLGGEWKAATEAASAALWRDVREAWDAHRAKQPPFPALQQAIDEVFESRIGDVSGRGKLGSDMREIWMMQPRFEKRVGSGPWSLVDQARFRAGFDFMRLRADVGEVDEVLADWWQEFSLADDATREDLLQQVRQEQQKTQRAPRVHSVRRAEKPAEDPRFRDLEPAQDATDEEGGAGPAKKRRRRRRKPSGGATGSAPAAE